MYDSLDNYYERTRYEKLRKQMLKNVQGKVLDAGCGTGRNFPHYGKGAEVVGIDLHPRMLAVAKQRAKQSKAKINLLQHDLETLPFSNNSFDAIVATFVLCVMPLKKERAVLKELVRVAKPGARFYFLEYVYSKNFYRRFLMRIFAFIPRLLFGLHYNTTLPAIEEEKRLEVEKLEFVYRDILRLIVVRKI